MEKSVGSIQDMDKNIPAAVLTDGMELQPGTGDDYYQEVSYTYYKQSQVFIKQELACWEKC